MKHIGLVCAVLLVMSLAGCGGGNSSNSAPAPSKNTAAQLSAGNWNLTASSTVYANTTSYIGGSLSSSNGVVTGVVHIAVSNCYSLLTDVPVTGTINSSNQVSITSAAINSQVIAASLQAPSGTSTMAGTYAIAGGCAKGDKGSVNGNIVPDISGSWSGNILSYSTDTNQKVVANITQSQTANSDGFYSLSGTFSFPNSVCFTAGTIQNSLSAGGAYLLTIATGNVTVYAVGSLNDMTTGKSMSVDYEISGGTCGGDSGTGTITRP